jgi:pilus assembly protein FimV
MMEQRAVVTQAPQVTETPAPAPQAEAKPEPVMMPAPVAVAEPEPAPEAVEPAPAAVEPEPVAAPAPEDQVVNLEPETVTLPDELVVSEPVPQGALFPLIPIGDEEASSYYAEAKTETVGTEGYKVAANDTLWEIANQSRPEGVSVNQMMVAMLHANPDAFQKNNINNLKRGVILRMPSQEELAAVEAKAANAEVKEQYALWREYRAQVAGTAIPQEAIPAAEEPKAAEAAEEGQTAETEQPASDLKILAPEAASATGEPMMAGGEDVASLQNDLALAKESLESARQENEDLKSRLEQLEQMLQKQERLMNLKDEQLSDMQQQLEKAGSVEMPAAASTAAAPEMAESEAAESEPSTEPETAAPETVVTETQTEQIVAAQPEAAETPAPEAEAAQPEVAATAETEVTESKPMPEEGQPEQGAVEGEEVVAVVEAPAEPVAEAPVQPEPVQKPELSQPAPVKAPSLVDDILADPKMLGIVGGGVLLVLALIAALLRRMGQNRAAKAAPVAAAPVEAPVFESPAPDFEQAPEAEQEVAEEAVEEVATMMEEAPSEEAPSKEMPVAGDQTQVFNLADQEAAAEAIAEEAASADDTISEADVYLAYGLHQQCEDLLKNALEQSPERDDYRAKLLENYFASKEQDKFENLASELYDRLGNASNPMWTRVAVMGKELAPENALFKDADVGGLSIDDVVQDKAEAAEFDLTAEDLAVGGTEFLEEAEEKPAEMAGDLEFDIGDVDLGDLDLGEESSEVSETTDTATLDIEPDLEMDVGDLDIEELDEALGDDALDLDIELEESDEVAETEVMTEMPSSPPETMVMEGPPDIELEEDSEKHDTGTLDISDMDLGELDLGDEIDMNASGELGLGDAIDFGESEGEVTEEMLAGDEAAFDLGDELDLEEEMGLPDSEDEVSTKLDLAKAYIDMGDNDGAKSTLEEVMNEGNDTQKKEAEGLLSQIS